ncbi:hypothetical protein EDD85DRAFT_959853 [Armillaria nabsnona]|nr:hypothetical protein EDD85DRAFT_959853 [Armillaria nabsnona]
MPGTMRRVFLIIDAQTFYKSITIDNPAGDSGESDVGLMSQTRQAGISSTLELVTDKNSSTGGLIAPDAEIDTLGLQSGFSLILSNLKIGGSEVLVIQGTHGTYDRLDALFGEEITPKRLVFAF